MDVRELNDMLRDLPPGEAAEVREFATRDLQEQNIYMYRDLMKMKRDVAVLKQRRTASERLMDFGNAAALVAYILFSNRDNIFPHP